MVDIHCHILPGIDDGSRTLEESIELIISAQKLGYKKLCCTSHYKKWVYENKNYEKILKDLRKELKIKNIDIKLLEGNEFLLDIDGLGDLKEKKVKTLNKSDYLLVEAMPGMTFITLKRFLEKIVQMKYKVVLAHAERYSYIDIKTLCELKKMGIVIQVNLKSLRHRKEIYEWIGLNLVDILASDAHDKKYRNYDLKDIIIEIENKFGIETRERLLKDNPQKIIDNEDIEGGVDEKKIYDISIDNDNFIKRFFKRFKFR
jgi:protein-tyrosine phosphatase